MATKVCIFGNKDSFCENKLSNQFNRLGWESKILGIEDTFISLDDRVEISHRKTDLSAFDVFIFWDINEQFRTHAHLVARHFSSMGKVVFDEIFCDEEYHEVKDYIRIIQSGISINQLACAFNIRTARDILIDINHPVLINIFKRRKKNILLKSYEWTDTYDLIRSENFSRLTFSCIHEKSEFIRLYMLGGKIMSSIKYSIPKGNHKVRLCNKEVIHLSDIPSELVTISDRIHSILKTSFWYVEYINANTTYTIFKVKRFPKFKTLSKLTKKSVSKKVAEFIAQEVSSRFSS